MNKVFKDNANNRGLPCYARWLCLVLSLLFLFVPFVASADTLSGSTYEITVSRSSSPPNITSNSSNSLPLSLTTNNIDNASLGNIDFTFYFNYDFNKGDKVTFTVFLYPNQRYTGFTDSGSKVQRADNFSNIINLSPVSFSRTSGEMVLEGTVLKDFNGYCFFDLSLSHPKFVSGIDMQQSVYIRFDSVDISVEDNQSGLLNTILQWLQDIWDKLSNGFTNIVSSLSDGFSNLINKVQSFIDDVGAWFSSLGDRISGFFTNLWDNIRDGFNAFREALRAKWQALGEWWDDLWTLPDGWGDDYKSRWSAWLSEHMGFLYQSIEVVKDLFNLIKDTIENGQPVSTISIPSMSFSFDGADDSYNITVNEASTFDFNDISGNSAMVTVRFVTTALIGTMLIVGTVIASKRKYDKIMEGRG